MFDLFFSHIFSADRLNAAILAMVLVSLVGMTTGPVWGNANPFLWALLDKICGRMISKTYNTDRSMASLHFRGALFLTLYLLITGILAAVALLIERRFHMAGMMEPVLLTLTLSGGAVWSSLVKLHHAIRGKSGFTKGSYYQVAVSTRTDLNSTDHHGILRSGIGFLATSFDKGVIAPLVWYLLGGLPGAFIYCGIAAARWSLSKDGFAKGIGTLALKLEMVFGILPQILSAILLALGALFTPNAGMTRSFIGMVRRNGAAPYAEGGLPMTALAYALGVSLGGPVQDISGSVLKRAWVGSPKTSARVERHHLRQAIYLNIVAFVLAFMCLVIGLMIWKIRT